MIDKQALIDELRKEADLHTGELFIGFAVEAINKHLSAPPVPDTEVNITGAGKVMFVPDGMVLIDKDELNLAMGFDDEQG